LGSDTLDAVVTTLLIKNAACNSLYNDQIVSINLVAGYCPEHKRCLSCCVVHRNQPHGRIQKTKKRKFLQFQGLHKIYMKNYLLCETFSGMNCVTLAFLLETDRECFTAVVNNASKDTA
jgi:hypothetical protein